MSRPLMPYAAAAIAGGVTTLAILRAVERLKRRRCAAVGSPLPHVSEEKVYLDWNATTPIFPEVTQAVIPYVSTEFGNPSSDHCFGASTRSGVAKARAQVAKLLACETDEIVFCGCGSEADNMALRSTVLLRRPELAKDATPHVISSAIEHPAITACLDSMAKLGEAEVTYVGVDDEGRVDPAEVAAAVRASTVLVSIMHSNNEVGTVQDIKAIASAAREAYKAMGGSCHELLVHTDAAQSVGKVAVHPKELGADLATVVGHKFGAPKGIAVLYVRKGVPLPPLLRGGGQEGGRRAGTEAVSQVVAMGAAAEVVSGELSAIAMHMRQLVKQLHQELVAALGKDSLRVNGPALSAGDVKRLPNTLSIGIKGASAGAILKDLSKKNVAASASAACHTADTAHAQVSFVLKAMKVPHEFALGTLRLSVGRHTTAEEVSKAAAAIALSCRGNGHM